MHSRLGSATLLQLAFPRESNLNFPREISNRDNTVVKTFLFFLKEGEKRERSSFQRKQKKGEREREKKKSLTSSSPVSFPSTDEGKKAAEKGSNH